MGAYDAENRLVASSVKFKGNDLEDAQTIQAGLQPAKEQIEQSQQELEEQKAALQRQQQPCRRGRASCKRNRGRLRPIRSRRRRARPFRPLSDYNIMDEVTVFFARGKVALTRSTKHSSCRWPRKPGVTAYPMQVKGYSSGWAGFAEPET